MLKKVVLQPSGQVWSKGCLDLPLTHCGSRHLDHTSRVGTTSTGGQTSVFFMPVVNEQPPLRKSKRPDQSAYVHWALRLLTTTWRAVSEYLWPGG